MDKYHIALSFAGEDREYVEKVAHHLRDQGVDVFYDIFEETKLWGKDLYTYLRDIYQNRAMFTVIFVSEAYKDKLWTNHERESAQAKAFAESKEYILPAKFDENVEIPGLLKTTGYIKLNDISPEEFAEKIIVKLKGEGVILKIDSKFIYSNEAKADIDFPMAKGDEVTQIINDLRSHNFYKQNPAIEKIFDLDWSKITSDQLFVLGRNIYQCACGGEKKAAGIIKNLRREMAHFPLEVAEHLINGMFYEIYFNPKGEFRGNDLKSQHLNSLFALQTVNKYINSITFIRKALKPYRSSLSVLPNTIPENVVLEVAVMEKDPPLISSIKFNSNELIVDDSEKEDSFSRMWTLSLRNFNIRQLNKQISRDWNLPDGQLKLECNKKLSQDTEYRLPEGKKIGNPFSK